MLSVRPHNCEKRQREETVTDPEPDTDSGRATVRNMRSKCRCSYVLQFTFRRAVRCVLHRPPSQVIHCAAWSSQKTLYDSNSKRRTIRKNESDGKRFISTREGGKSNRDSSSVSRRRRLYKRFRTLRKRTRHPQSDRQSVSQSAKRGTAPPRHRSCSGRDYSRRASANDTQIRFRSLSSKKEETEKPVMILPQVHLRKPCYDFYFL